MTLRHMIIFKEVCSHESISRAAESLNIAQPSVSLAIRELENYYNVKLFERMKRRIFLTEKGRLLLTYATNIVNQFNEAKELVSDKNGFSLLRIGSNDTSGHLLLPSLLESFNQKHPNIRVCTYVKNSESIKEMLSTNEIDLALVDNITISPYFDSKLIKKEKLVLVCGEKFYPELTTLTIQQLSELPLLYRETGSGLRRITDSVFESHGYTIHPIIESTSSDVLIAWACHNLGIFITSKSLASPYIKQNKLRLLELTDAEFTSYYYVLTHKNKYLEISTQYFLDLLEQEPE